jgi:hypothetical protein
MPWSGSVNVVGGTSSLASNVRYRPHRYQERSTRRMGDWRLG